MDRIRLTDQADAVLSVSTNDQSLQEFLVSSTLLRAGSPVFEQLFYGPMAEAQALKEGLLEPTKLEDDDADAMHVLLSVLHHKPPESPIKDLELLARTALLSKKYLCMSVLQPWLIQWLDRVHPSTTHEVDMGISLLILHLTGATESFRETAVTALRTLHQTSLEVWGDHELLNLLPNEFITNMKRAVPDALNAMRVIIERQEESLYNEKTRFPMRYCECDKCGRRHPQDAKKCHPCRNIDLRPLECTSELRVVEYLGRLREVGLWGNPSLPYTTQSVDEIVHRMSRAKSGAKHTCEAGKGCPFYVQMESVVRDLHALRENLRWP